MSGPKLPETSKDLLRRLAEELLVLNGRVAAAEEQAAEARRALEAALAERSPRAHPSASLQQRLKTEGAAVAQAQAKPAEAGPGASPSPSPRSHRAQPQRQRPEEVLTLRSQLEEERRRRRVAEERVRHLEGQVRHLEGQLLEEHTAQQQQQQQQQQARPAPAAQQAAQQAPPSGPAPRLRGEQAAEADAGQQQAAAEQEGEEVEEIVLDSGNARCSSDADETFSEPAGVDRPASAAPHSLPREQQGVEADGIMLAAAAEGGGGEGGAAPLRALAASRKRSGAAAGPPPAAKQRRREPPSAVLGSASPGESALHAAAVLHQGLRTGQAAPRAATGSSMGPPAHQASTPTTQDGAAGNLLLSLKEGGASRRRAGRRGGAAGGAAAAGAGVSGGGMSLKPGETAQQWLNRSAAVYVSALLSNAPLRTTFGAPVPRDTPGYSEAVPQPMDLGTIKARAAAGRYRSPQQLRDDLDLVVDNAQLFNPSSHPVHRTAQNLRDQLDKQHSFYSKVADLFQQAQLDEELARQRAQREKELEAEEAQLAASVRGGMTVAVYAEDDEGGNKYYLIRASGPVERLAQNETDDFGADFKKGDSVIRGCYFDYWKDRFGSWDRARRPYYLQSDRTALSPASSLLAVGLDLAPRAKPEVSPYDGKQHSVYEAPPDLHRRLRTQLARFLQDVPR